jgi:hypothetical protein
MVFGFYSANAFALFLKSQRKWTSPPLTESSIAEFKKRMEEHGYTSNMVLPHGSYLINLGNPDALVSLQTLSKFVMLMKLKLTWLIERNARNRMFALWTTLNDVKLWDWSCTTSSALCMLEHLLLFLTKSQVPAPQLAKQPWRNHSV